MNYREALEKVKALLPPVETFSDEYWERDKILNTLWCAGFREERFHKAINILLEPEYLQLIIDKFKSEDKPGFEKHVRECILREAFNPYWRLDIGLDQLLEARTKYKLSDFELECLDTIESFTESIECGGIMSCDGQGEFILKRKRIPVKEFTVAECKKMQAKGCKYVLWYNK